MQGLTTCLPSSSFASIIATLAATATTTKMHLYILRKTHTYHVVDGMNDLNYGIWPILTFVYFKCRASRKQIYINKAKCND